MIEFFMQKVIGIPVYQIITIIAIIIAFIPVSHGVLTRTKNMFHKSSLSMVLLMVGVSVYFLFKEGVEPFIDRALGVVLFASVMALMFIFFKWKK